MRIGLDLDNTLICYDQAFLRVGKEEGILPASFEGNKVAVKRAAGGAVRWLSVGGTAGSRLRPKIDAAILSTA
jgi:hypothetical protein